MTRELYKIVHELHCRLSDKYLPALVKSANSRDYDNLREVSSQYRAERDSFFANLGVTLKEVQAYEMDRMNEERERIAKL
jgi:hypothetical protein